MGSTAPPMGQPAPYQEGEYRSLTQNSRVSWALDQLHPPSDLYITRDDVLVVQGTSSIAGEIINFQGRLLTIDGVIIPLQGQLRLGAAGVTAQVVVPLAEGFLLSLVAAGTNAVLRGQTFVRAALSRAGTNFPGSSVLLLSEYVTIFSAIGWPWSTYKHPVDGSGAIVALQATTPGAGVDWGFTFPNNTRNRVLAIHAFFTTSAAAANRNIELVFTGPVSTVWRVSAPVSIVASTTAHINAGQAFQLSGGVVTSDIVIALPGEFYMLGSGTVAVVTTNIQAADQWSIILIDCEQWLDGI